MATRLGEVKLITDGLILALDPSSDLNYSLNEVEVLVVAGGGSGGAHGGNDGSGGGGAGGLIYRSAYPVTANTGITVTVGNGGASATTQGQLGNNGQNSVFGSLTASGGGGGGSEGVSANRPGAPGGSGGGAGGYGVKSGGTGVPGQGFRGGDCTGPGDGGGGGAGAAGEDGGTGKGGDGLIFNISGAPKYYAGGGGAGGDQRNARGPFGGFGGAGGGGRGQDAGTTGSTNTIAALAGVDGTGGGGGGAAGLTVTYGAGTSLPSGKGGNGIVIVRYPGPRKANGGDNIESVGGYTIHTFTNSGTFTPLSRPSNGGTLLGLQDFIAYPTNLRSLGTNLPTFNTSNSGTFTTDDTGYLECSRFDPTLNFQPQNPFSVFVWIYNPGNISSGSLDTGAIISNMRSGNNTFGEGYVGWDFWINDTTTLAAHFIKAWSGNAIKIGIDFNYSAYSNSWAYIGYTYNGSAPTTNETAIDSMDFYVNGVLSTTNKSNKNGTTTFSADDQQINYHPSQRLRINSRWDSGGITQGSRSTYGPVQIYNKKLSASEVLQNFNALKGRFGL